MARSGSAEAPAQPLWRIPISDFSRFKIMQSPREAFSPTFSKEASAAGNEGVPNSKPHPRKPYIYESRIERGFVAQGAVRWKRTPCGAKINPLNKGRWWKLVTCNFLHVNEFHFLFSNCWFNSIGPHVETISGPRRYLALYFTSAIAGSAMSYGISNSPSLGASGAVCGLVGSYVVHIMRHRDLLSDDIEQLSPLAIFIPTIMLSGLASKRIGNWGHLGGFLGGAAMSWFVGPAWKFKSENDDGDNVFINRAPITYLLNTKPEFRICK